MTNADTDIQELSNFLLDFATTLMGVGSHTSRVVRNVNRIAESFGYGVDMTIFQRNITSKLTIGKNRKHIIAWIIECSSKIFRFAFKRCRYRSFTFHEFP